MTSNRRQYSHYVHPASMSNSRPCMVRLSRLLRYLVLVTFCAMISLSSYIFLNFLTTFDNGQIIPQRRSPLIRSSDDNKMGFAPREPSGHLLKRSDNFRERYKHLYESQSVFLGSDVVKDNGKWFIYRCDTSKMSGCADWADHVKGIEAAYIIANLTGRVFKAEMHGFPCKLTDYIQPNVVNWTLYKTFHAVLNKGMAGISIRNFDNNPSFYNNLYKLELLEIVPENFEHVYFKSNLDYISGFQNATLYRKQLSWMQGLARDEIHAILYKRLFLLAPRLLKKLELFLYSILPSPEHRLICVDLGTKTNWSRSFEDDRVNQLKYLSNIWSFIRTHSSTNIDKVFINTDSSEVLSLAKTEHFRGRLVTSPQRRPISSHSEQLHSVCESLEADIFSQHILVNCDILVVSNNSLGHLAAYLRETDNGLNCLMGNGHIHPCRADRLSELYMMHE